MAPWTGAPVSSNQQFVLPRTCTVPLETLVSAPYNLLSGEGVWARIVCGNVLGNSMASNAGNDAIIPRPADSCLNLNMIARNTNSIQFGWTDGISNGGAPIECYKITYQQIAGVDSGLFDEVMTDEYCIGSFNSVVTNNVRQYTASGLTNGGLYRFNVFSQNVAGDSLPCTIELMACVAPSSPVRVVEVPSLRTVGQLGISWSDGGNLAHDASYTVHISYRDTTGTTRTEKEEGIVGN